MKGRTMREIAIIVVIVIIFALLALIAGLALADGNEVVDIRIARAAAAEKIGLIPAGTAIDEWLCGEHHIVLHTAVDIDLISKRKLGPDIFKFVVVVAQPEKPTETRVVRGLDVVSWETTGSVMIQLETTRIGTPKNHRTWRLRKNGFTWTFRVPQPQLEDIEWHAADPEL